MDNKEEIRVVTQEELDTMSQVLLPISKKIYHFDSEINLESFTKFVEFVNAHADQSIIELWLNSPGGDCMVAEMLRDLIEDYQIPVVACYVIASSAFNIFMTANTVKRIVPGTKAVYHRSFFPSIRLDDKFKPVIDSEFRRVMGESYRCVDETNEKVKLNVKQKRMYKKGEDINFTYAEIISIIKELDDENFIIDNQVVKEKE